MICKPLLNENKWVSTTIRKNAVAAEYSTSSEAVKRMSKFSEKSPEDIESGVVPEKERFSESNLSHGGRGVLSPEEA